jgi:hypothetical protein
MLYLVFARPSASPKTVGPLPSFLIEGRKILSPDGSVVAVHRNHRWELQGIGFSRLDCEARILVSFANGREASRPLGAYAHFSCVDGIAYCDHHVFAFVDEKADAWYCYDDGRHWRTLSVTPAPFP